MPSKTWVMAVHKWETTDGKHHVDIMKHGKIRVKRFKDWYKAERYAENQAHKLGLASYTIDHPNSPHKEIPTGRAKSPKKTSGVANYVMG